MEKVYLMAVDLGTTYIKAAVYDTEGTQLSFSRVPVKSDSSRPGVFLQSGEEIYQSVLLSMREAVQRSLPYGGDVAAIGFTGQMAGFIGVDSDWNDITSWSCSLDTRYVPYADGQMRTMSEKFLNICGTNAPLMSAKCKWFVSEFPKEAARVAKYMLISSYVAGRLGGVKIEDATLSSSYITWTGLADVHSRTWSDELCASSGIRRGLLPEIVDYHAVAGYLSPEAASLLGLNAGIPLIAGAGDKIAGCIGSGIVEPGDTVFEASSFGAVSVLAEGYYPNPRRRDYDAIPAAEPNMYYLHKYMPGSGITLQWFLDTFGDTNGDSEDAFLGIESEIRDIPCGSEGLMAVGLLGGSAIPFDGDIRGVWTGYTWSHTRAHFYRSLLESFAYELAGTLDSIRSMYPEWDRYGDIIMIGGGAGSGVWRQILADVTGCRFVCGGEYDATLWGAAVLAGKGIGVFKDLKKASGRKADPEEIAVPTEENRKVYERYRAVYDSLSAHMSPVCRRLLKIEREEGKK